MVEYFRQLIRGPAFMDEDRERISQLIHTVLLASMLAVFVYGVVVFALSPTFYVSHTIIILILVHLVITWVFARRGHLTLASLSLTTGLWVLFSAAFLFTGGVTNPSVSGYLLIIMMAGLLMGRRASGFFAALSFLATTGLLLLEQNGLLPPFDSPINLLVSSYTLQTLYILVTATMLYLTIRRVQSAYQQARTNADALLQLNQELQKEIQDRLLLVDALQESEARNRILVEHAPDAILVYDVDARCFVDVNKSATQLLGRSHEELLKIGPLAFSPSRQPNGQSSVSITQTYIEKALRGEMPVFEWWLYDAQQNHFPCEVRFVRLPAAQQRLIRCSLIDIRERKWAEEQQQTEHQRLQQIIEAIPTAVIISSQNESRNILWINRLGAKYAGLPAEELIGRSVLDFCADEAGRQEIVALTQGQAALQHHEIRLRNGHDVVAWNRVSIVPFAFQNQSAHLTIVINTQKLKLAEEALRESEERFRVFVEQSFSGIVISADGVILDVNESFARMFGYSSEEMLGLTPLETQTPESAQRVLAHITAKKEGPIEAVGVRKDGSTFPMEIIAKNTIYHGKQARLGAVFDLTEKKRVEEALRQTQKMESLGILAGGVAHDFNNLLVAMLGQASVALAKLDENERARPHIEKMKSAAERAAALTHQLLAYSGGGQFNVQPLQLNTLVQDNIRLFELAVPPHVQLESHLDTSLPLIEADAGQMQQVLMNLILNGAEAIVGKPGNVRLSTERYYLKDDEWRERYGQLTGQPLAVGNYVCLQVEDDGLGMDQEMLARIFDPFFSTKATGRGLGLAAVLGIMRGHQGGVMVTSQPGVGTCYHLLFPALTASHLLADNPVEKLSALENRATILLIDDEISVREALEDILTLENFNVFAAADGQTGLDLFQQHRATINLVILDLSMPGLSGEDTYGILRRLSPDIKIVLSSGYSEKEIIPVFAHDPFTSFLQKPYDLQQLINHVHSVLYDQALL
ncbi:MAG: PAS domain S-box protein [Chloroflexi bacterium]|nr:PAS domain S-box protein [Chloroflexota bacterium]